MCNLVQVIKGFLRRHCGGNYTSVAINTEKKSGLGATFEIAKEPQNGAIFNSFGTQPLRSTWYESVCYSNKGIKGKEERSSNPNLPHCRTGRAEDVFTSGENALLH